jgi:hypothetical protein
MSADRYDGRTGPRDRSLRVGDKEREAVAEILQQHHVDGRLDADEFQARLERSMRAKTYADLDALVADFPRDEPEGRAAGRRPWPRPLLLLPVAVALAIFAGAHVAWLIVPLVFFFVVRPLLWGGAWGCGPRRSWRSYRTL